ncbi:MAG TPA: glycosyltransferase family 1 protein [Polyangiaceae bacterium]|jgi:glycosyltransferase involved in cell wall biosynthesis|nr:glycosyltransferase family 1 protein [Polyangiaceae bacterium]
MDLVADKLLEHLEAHHPQFAAERVCPSFHVRFGGVPVLGARRQAFNADRLLNRLHDYPRFLRSRAGAFDLFHVCDHSYANLIHELPARRVGVFCHDLDTFRSVLTPESDPRPGWFKAMARRALGGLQKAAIVFHTTSTVRAEIERHGLVDPARLVQAPYGIASEFSPTPSAQHDAAATGLLRSLGGAPFLLHVGSCIPRKRVDVLLEVFAAVRRKRAGLRLVQVGGEWTAEHRTQLARHEIESAVLQLPRMAQAEIAALYRRAALVMMPSQSEGFGLPVVEALASGGIVVASDIPVFREVGGGVAVYCPFADLPAWTDTVERLLSAPASAPAREARLNWASQFSWAEHAQRIAAAYHRLTQ